MQGHRRDLTPAAKQPIRPIRPIWPLTRKAAAAVRRLPQTVSFQRRRSSATPPVFMLAGAGTYPYQHPDMTTLIHLVSGQTLQNFLPMLALQPDRVIQIRSSDRRFDRPCAALHRAAALAGFPGKIEDRVIPAESPGIGESEAAVRAALEGCGGQTAVVNLSGGTKLMAIGALRAAGNLHPAFYCDTESRGEFVPDRRCKQAGPFLDLRSEVQASDKAEAIGESDLLGISRRRRGLVFVSCKVSDQHVKPLEHAFEFSKRAQEFGGTAASAVFVFHRMLNADKRAQLESACQVLRSRLVVGPQDLESWLNSA